MRKRKPPRRHPNVKIRATKTQVLVEVTEYGKSSRVYLEPQEAYALGQHLEWLSETPLSDDPRQEPTSTSYPTDIEIFRDLDSPRVLHLAAAPPDATDPSEVSAAVLDEESARLVASQLNTQAVVAYFNN